MLFYLLVSLQTPLEVSRDVGLEINAEKTKYMIMSRYPNSGQNQNIRTANESFENVAKFKYLRTTLTNQNDIHDEIKSRLNSRNACYHSVQNLFSSRLISNENENFVDWRQRAAVMQKEAVSVMPKL
jgi:archaellum component FlaC